MDNPLIIGLVTGGAFLLSFLLFNHPRNFNIVANRWLGLFVIALALSALHIFLNNLNLQVQYQKVLLLIEVTEFITAPALYLSIIFFTIPGRTLKKTDLWHFVPAAVILLFLMKPLLTDQNVHFSDNFTKEVVLTILVLIRPVQAVAYLFFSYRKLNEHQYTIQQVSSSTEAINLVWLKYLILVWAVAVLIWLNLAFFNFTHVSNYTPFIYLAGVYCLAYFSLKQQEIYAFAPSEIKELEPVISIRQPLIPERQKRLSNSQLSFLENKLGQLMRDEKVYLDNRLSLPVLAQRVGISAHDLSYFINEVYGENFYSFVNRHRVEEAKHLLLSQMHDQLNMLGIAYQAGFNSKTAFNTAFKKWTGKSPTQFLQSPMPQNQAKQA